MKKLSKGWIAPILLLMTLIGYATSVYHYKDVFGPGSAIGTIAIGGKTKEEVSELVRQVVEEDVVQVMEGGEVIEEIPLHTLGDFNNQERVDEVWNKRNPYTLSIVKANFPDFDFDPVKRITEEDFLERLHIDQDRRQVPQDAYIDPETFELMSEVPGTTIDTKKLYDQFTKTGQVILDEVYESVTITDQDPVLNRVYDKLQNVLSQDITLTVKGEEIPVPGTLIKQGLSYNPDGHAIGFNSDVLIDFVVKVDEGLREAGKPFDFISTLQGDVEVPGATLGWEIDINDTLYALKLGILQEEGVVDATIIGDGYDLSPESGSYVEVDLTHQKLFIYVDGSQVLETDIVSGMALADPPTPTYPGSYQVWNMESPSVLVGVNQQMNTEYRQPVDYWIPFDYGGQGIHDANWQSSFGGDAYHYAGSQGCINVPPGVMPEVYDWVEVGFPVMVFE